MQWAARIDGLHRWRDRTAGVQCRTGGKRGVFGVLHDNAVHRRVSMHDRRKSGDSGRPAIRNSRDDRNGNFHAVVTDPDATESRRSPTIDASNLSRGIETMQSVSQHGELPQASGTCLLTDSGLETTLIFDEGLDLPAFAAYPLLGSAEGRQILRRYYRRHLAIARDHGSGFLLEAPTWRASRDWGATLGHGPDETRTLQSRSDRASVRHPRAGAGHQRRSSCRATSVRVAMATNPIPR